MKQLEEPKFFTTPIWGNISIVLGFILAFSFSKNLSDTLLVIIIILLLLIFFLWNFVKYLINWHNFYNNYKDFYKKFNGLENRYNMRIDEIKNKEMLIDEYDKFIEYLNLYIVTTLTQNSEKEISQLKNLQSWLYLSIEHFNKMKGVNDNGRNIYSCENC